MASRSVIRLGNLKGFWYDAEGYPRITIGPHWPFFLGLSTTFLILGISFTCYLTTGWLQMYGIFAFIFCMPTYFMTAMKNPGIETSYVEPDMLTENEKQPNYYWRVCEVEKHERTYHCDIWDVCIR